MRLLLLPYLLAAANGAFAPAASVGRLDAFARCAVSPGGLEVDPAPQAPQIRKKVNEIDFCMAPSDVSLSRSYGSAAAADLATDDADDVGSAPRVLSLTRALNNASNRALRRILLSRSWPSAEALNLSLRQVLASDRGAKGSAPTKEEEVESTATVGESGAKCPVPRPILNIITRRRSEDGVSIDGSEKGVVAMPRSKRGRSDEEWVADQLSAFRESYGALPGYPLAEAYLECILSLATSGEESVRKSEVLADGIYDDSYRRFLTVLASAGATLEPIPDSDPPRTKIAQKVVNNDICLSMMDKLLMKNEKSTSVMSEIAEEDLSEDLPTEAEPVSATESSATASVDSDNAGAEGDKGGTMKKLFFWMKSEGKEATKTEADSAEGKNAERKGKNETESVPFKELKPEDLGAVLLSAEEPSMTRQLNVLSNIVQRALLFGGEQELLVLSETLEADLPAFVQRWYPESSLFEGSDKGENRPGVQYFNSLVQLLKDCYNKGAVTDLNPPFPLAQSYANAYERLTAGLVELGSGYMRPMKMRPMIPKSATEELNRLAQWESSFRKSSAEMTSYPEDLVGSYEVKDEIGGETIGMTTVVLKPEGEIEIAPPLQGLRWRLDPGPTHLDTCTFQVLGDDGTILQYRGFVDRGARLESRFSKRPIKIRGAVTFQMRDGESVLMGEDYRKDVLPISYQTGTTRFVMTKAAT
eukprot:CAMPEP_0113556550 /NCGR_PEP_ID=MMETSP0015_2-20120614/17313_1 /TAXON_ID=2838 /ORGANISM="Odontella" /LENGTH=700 /DNA_ID=CAMNT_0000457907 /DNA_START=144 /DNA_END=2246 /DNA_ORIENTATION=- /assembly_acc=CAM_ASM_000160